MKSKYTRFRDDYTQPDLNSSIDPDSAALPSAPPLPPLERNRAWHGAGWRRRGEEGEGGDEKDDEEMS